MQNTVKFLVSFLHRYIANYHQECKTRRARAHRHRSRHVLPRFSPAVKDVMTRRRLSISGLGLLLCLCTRVWGHGRLVKSVPTQGATLAEAPPQIHLWFSEPIEARFSQLSVWNAHGQRVDDGAVLADPQDSKKLTVGLQALGAGRYTVQYRVLSVDSHIVASQWTFTVQSRP